MVRLTGKQRQFLDLYAKTGEAKHAAISVGYTPISAPQMAKRILESSVAQEYLSSIRSASNAITGYTVAKAMEETDDAIAFARDKGNAMAIVKAVELRCKLSGLLIERIHIEKVDLSEALRQANLRIIDVIQPSLALPSVVSDSGSAHNQAGGGTGGGGGEIESGL